MSKQVLTAKDIAEICGISESKGRTLCSGMAVGRFSHGYSGKDHQGKIPGQHDL